VPEVLAGVREDWRRRTAEMDEGVTPGFFEITDAWPSDAPGGPGDLYDALTSANADAIVLVGPLGDAALQSLMIAASSAGCRVFATRRRAFQRLDEPSFLLRRAEPLALLSRPALVGVQLVVKRFVDLAGAVVGLVVGAPLVALIAVLVRATSRGPVLFKQVRVGLGGDPFTLLKFRTMVEDAEAQQAALARANQYASDPLFKVKGDPRLTTVGRFLRRSSLDELPQLINVLMGDMTLVGPRPFPEYHLAAFDTAYRLKRCSVVPGLTGLWQVDRQDNGLAGQIELDTYYIDNLSLRLDAYIILKTIKTVVTFRNG